MDNAMKVMIVDDEDEICSSLGETLSDSGYDVRVSNNPLRALESIKRGGVDIIISDIRMPGINGLEFLRRAKALHPEVHSLIITAYGDMAAAIDRKEPVAPVVDLVDLSGLFGGPAFHKQHLR